MHKIMSIYGSFDYLDVLSRASLVSPREQGIDVVTAPETEEEEDYLLVLDDAAASTAAESADLSTLPSEVNVPSANSSTNTEEGVTILASLPSEEAAAALREQQQLQALSMQVQGAPVRFPRTVQSTASLSTTESRFTDVVHDDDPSSVSSLSLSMMSSLPSSGFSEDFSLQTEEDASVSVSSRSSSDDESTKVRGVKEASSPHPLSRPWFKPNSKGPWYTNLKTEADWEAFRTECYAIMEAMGDDAPKDPDAMLAQLIAQEEEILYKTKTAGFFLGMSYETVAMLAGAVLVPLVGYAFVSRNRREKAN